HGTAAEWQRAIADALDYHQLLACSPAQPVEVLRPADAAEAVRAVEAVEAARPERAAMPPPANPEVSSWQAPAPAASAALSEFSHLMAAVESPAPELIVVEPNARRFGLQVVGRFVELLPGVTVVGRSRTCHIPIPDPQISRRHATFANNGRDVHVRNVSQTNGVRVNGVLIERDAARELEVGARIMLGSHEIELCGLGDYCPSFEPTQSTAQLQSAPPDAANGSTLLMLAQVAEKYFV